MGIGKTGFGKSAECRLSTGSKRTEREVAARIQMLNRVTSRHNTSTKNASPSSPSSPGSRPERTRVQDGRRWEAWFPSKAKFLLEISSGSGRAPPLPGSCPSSTRSTFGSEWNSAVDSLPSFLHGERLWLPQAMSKIADQNGSMAELSSLVNDSPVFLYAIDWPKCKCPFINLDYRKRNIYGFAEANRS